MRRLPLAVLVLAGLALGACARMAAGDRPFPCTSASDCLDGWACPVPAAGEARVCRLRTAGPAADECDLAGDGSLTPRVDGATWTVQLGGAGDEFPTGVARAADGALYVSGILFPRDSTGLDAFLLKLSATGDFEWCRRTSTGDASTRESWDAVAVLGDGIYVTGTTNGAVAPGAGERDNDLLLARYDASGRRIWLVQEDFGVAGVSSADRGFAIAVDAEGRLRVVGETTGAVPGESATANQDSAAALYVAYDAAGQRLAATDTRPRLGGFATATAVASGLDGRVVATVSSTFSLRGSAAPDGTFAGAWASVVDLPPAAAPGVLFEAPLLVTDQSDASLRPRAVAVAGADTLVAGGVSGGLFDTVPLGSSDAWVALVRDGKSVWIERFGTSASDEASDVLPCGADFCVAGRTFGVLAPGAPDGRQADAFVARFSVTGELLRVSQFGTDGAEEVTGLVDDGQGGLVVVGTTEGDLGRRNRGGNDLFVRRLVP